MHLQSVDQQQQPLPPLQAAPEVEMRDASRVQGSIAPSGGGGAGAAGTGTNTSPQGAADTVGAAAAAASGAASELKSPISGNVDAAIAAVQQRLKDLDKQAEQLAGELKTARDAWLKADPGDKADYKEAYEDLKAETAKLDARRKDLEAQLTPGAGAGPSGTGAELAANSTLAQEASAAVQQALQLLVEVTQELKGTLKDVAAIGRTSNAITQELKGTLKDVAAIGRTSNAIWWQRFRYSGSNITRKRDPKFKTKLIQALGAELGAPPKLIRDTLLNEFLPSTVVIAAHLFKLCWHGEAQSVVGLKNVNDLRNALLLNKRPILSSQQNLSSRHQQCGRRVCCSQPAPSTHQQCRGRRWGVCCSQPAAAGNSQASYTCCQPAFECLGPALPACAAGAAMAHVSSTSSTTASSGIPMAAAHDPSAAQQAQAASASSRTATAPQVTSECDGGELVAYYLGELDWVATDFHNWPWGSEDVDPATKEALQQYLGRRTVRELVEGKVLTFVESLPLRPFLRCLLFQAKQAVQTALSLGRVTQQELDRRGINTQQFVEAHSPEGSWALQTFLRTLDQAVPLAALEQPAEQLDAGSTAGTSVSVQSDSEQSDNNV